MRNIPLAPCLVLHVKRVCWSEYRWMNGRWLAVSIVVCYAVCVTVKSVLRDVHVELELLLSHNHNGSKK